MRVTVTPDVAIPTARHIADVLGRAIDERGRAVFIGSAGRTPTSTYARLATHHRGDVDWSRVVFVQMDEYLGVTIDDPTSLASYSLAHVIAPLGIRDVAWWHDRSGHLVRPLGQHAEPAANADLVLHGIGRNGHVGFNEPPSSADAPTRILELAADTIENNGTPHRLGVTLGMDVLRTARHTVLLATGRAKAAAVAAAVTGIPSPDCPASWLRDLPDYRVILDPAADGGTAHPAEDTAEATRTGPLSPTLA